MARSGIAAVPYLVASALVALALMTLASASGARAEVVRLDGKPWAGKPLKLTATLKKPPGDGPFAAVVLMHGCSGLDRHHFTWAKRLVAWGYVALVVDSFSSRGETNVCGDLMRISPVVRTQDAYAAAAYLAELPFVDGGRIALMGWSHGGSTTRQAVSAPLPGAKAFGAAIAFYPWCRNWLSRLEAPLLILIGDLDDWTPAARCQRMVVSDKAAFGVTLKVYPGATHSFDREGLNTRYFGHRLESNPQATADAIERVKAFLATHLQ